MKNRPDINDTACTEGLDAARARHDRAHKFKAGPQILPSPKMPMAVARQYINDNCKFHGLLTLRHWRGAWWRWRTSHWEEVDDRTVRSWLYAYTEEAQYLGDKTLVAWSPNRYKITDVVDALSAVCILQADLDQPTWLDNRLIGTIVATANGLLDISELKLLPHSPQFFNQTAVPFNYDPSAPKPLRWLNFLTALWPNEPEAVHALGEWFGYIISGRTDLHKILLMVGPTRGGKGVIARILATLVGEKNVAGPTLNSLGGEFGLAPLIGKPLAIISDARFAGKNSNIVTERLLSISGEDSLTVNRKYREQWTGKLPSRLHIISNELPKLGDASTAIIGRIVLLLLSSSWLGREDHHLEARLHEESAGILNWALAGLHRLTVDNANSFTRVITSDEAIVTLRDLASPVGAFVRERCEINPVEQVRIDDLYATYKSWSEDNGHERLSREVFGRNIRAVVPSIRVSRPREQDRKRVYSGIALRSAELRQ